MNTTQSILHEKFLEMQMRNPRFTLRAYAKRVGISSGALSEILSGKRKLTPKSAKRIAEGLGLNPSESAALAGSSKAVTQSPRAKATYERLADDQFHLIADWWHYGILNLLRTRGFKPEATFIARRFGLSENVIERAVDRLERMKLLKKAGAKWTRLKSRLETSDGILNLSVRKSHLQDLELARTSLESDSVDRRDFTSMTFAIDSRRLGEAKALIRDFQDAFIEKFESAPADEVYRLSVQLFPLTKKGAP